MPRCDETRDKKLERRLSSSARASQEGGDAPTPRHRVLPRELADQTGISDQVTFIAGEGSSVADHAREWVCVRVYSPLRS